MPVCARAHVVQGQLCPGARQPVCVCSTGEWVATDSHSQLHHHQPHQHQPYPANRFSFPGFRCVSNLDRVVPELCVSLHHTSYICPGLLPPCTGVKAGRLHVLIIRPVPKVPTNEANLWQKETGSCLTIIVLADWYQHRSSPEYTFFFLFDTRHCRRTFPGHSRATSMAVISNFTTLTDCTNDAICA